jgi:hypothetical protein
MLKSPWIVPVIPDVAVLGWRPRSVAALAEHMEERLTKGSSLARAHPPALLTKRQRDTQGGGRGGNRA